MAYSAPVPSSPPVANANYANSAGTANYAKTAGFANSSGLPAWSQESNSWVGDYVSGINTTGNYLLVYIYDGVVVYGSGSCTTSPYFSSYMSIIPPNGNIPRSIVQYYRASNHSCYTYTFYPGSIILSAFSS